MNKMPELLKKTFQRHPLRFFLVLCFFVVSCIFLPSRWIFFYRFNPKYMKDFFEHSQWSIPTSPRTMGDGDLYIYSGYLLAQGGEVFSVNPETPPFVKYLYGFSILLTGNPYWVSVFFYFASLAVFILLAKRVLIENSQVYYAVLLFLLSPIFFSQITQTGMDLPQLFFFLIHVYLLFLSVVQKHQKNAYLFSLLSGFFLGAFSSTKIAVFSPLIFILAAVFYWQKKRARLILSLAVGSGVGFILPYTAYFIHGHSILEWIRAQKWVLSFYLSGKVISIPLMVWLTALTGLFKGWWADSWTVMKEWSIVLPVGVLSFLLSLFLSYKKWLSKQLEISHKWEYIILFSVCYLGLNSILPFWPRYLLILVPFLLLFIAKTFSFSSKFSPLFLFLAVFQCVFFLAPQPFHQSQWVKESWEKQSFSELYGLIDSETQKDLQREEFIQEMREVSHALSLKGIHATLKTPVVWPWQKKAEGQVQLRYSSDIGELTYTPRVEFIKEHGQWKLLWNWNYVLPNLEKNDTLTVVHNQHTSGVLKTADNITLSENGQQDFLYLIPNKVQNSEVLLNEVKNITGEEPKNIRVKLYVLSLHDRPIPINYVLPTVSPDVLTSIASQSGVLIQKENGRKYNKGLTSPFYTAATLLYEKQHPEVYGKSGGEIFINKPNGEMKKIFESPPLNGTNITLNEKLEETLQILPKEPGQ